MRVENNDILYADEGLSLALADMRIVIRLLTIIVSFFSIQSSISDAFCLGGDSCCLYGEQALYDKQIDECTLMIDNPVYSKHSAYYLRGTARMAKNQFDKAIDDFTKALNIYPEYGLAFEKRGAVYYAMQRYDKAIQDFSMAIKFHRASGSLHIHRGDAFLHAGQFDKAIEDYSIAITYAPNDSNPYLVRGSAYLEHQQYGAAQSDFQKALEIDPNNSSSRLRLAEIYSVTNKFTEACLMLKGAIENGHINWTGIQSSQVYDNLRGSSCYAELKGVTPLKASNHKSDTKNNALRRMEPRISILGLGYGYDKGEKFSVTAKVRVYARTAALLKVFSLTNDGTLTLLSVTPCKDRESVVVSAWYNRVQTKEIVFRLYDNSGFQLATVNALAEVTPPQELYDQVRYKF